jgi:hypothetical protein
MNSEVCTHSVYFSLHSIEGEFIPQQGDEVSYRLCLIPPKMEKHQAIHVQITNFSPERHHKWEWEGDHEASHIK